MTLNTIEALAAILYTVGEDGIDEAQLLETLAVDSDTLNTAISQLNLPGLEIHQYGNRFILTTQREAEPYIESLIINKASTKLSQAAMELSLIHI